MDHEQQRPGGPGGAGVASLGKDGNSRAKYITRCQVCGISTTKPLYPTCHAWGLLGKHIELAAQWLREV